MQAAPDAVADVAFFIPSMAGGGVERVVLNLAAGLLERGRSVDLVLMRATGELLTQVPPGVRVVDLAAPVRHDATFVLSLPSLVRYLRARPPRVLYSAITTVNLVALWARRWARAPTRVVVSEHVPVSTNARTHPLKRVLPWLIGRAYPGADAVVAVAADLADDLARATGFPRDRVAVVYNPAVTPALLAQSRERPDHPWFGDDVPVILGVGRLHPQKDFATLLDAFARLRASRPVRLLILGEGPERGALEAQVARLGLTGDVGFPGFVSNPAAYMGHAALFAMSSVYEGLAMVLIEALACGCPVVSTQCLSGPREILADGRFGRLVPVGDAAALAQAMGATLDAPPSRDTLRRRGLDFSLERVADSYLELFDGLGAADGVAARA